MARKKLSRIALLGAIHKAPTSGYGLKRYFARAHVSFWSESEGLLAPHEEEAESGGEKTVYPITEAGEGILNFPSKW